MNGGWAEDLFRDVAHAIRTLEMIYRNFTISPAARRSLRKRGMACRFAPVFFPPLGVSPMPGRDILPGEDQPGHGKVVIYGLWLRRFNADKRDRAAGEG